MASLKLTVLAVQYMQGLYEMQKDSFKEGVISCFGGDVQFVANYLIDNEGLPKSEAIAIAKLIYRYGYELILPMGATHSIAYNSNGECKQFIIRDFDGKLLMRYSIAKGYDVAAYDRFLISLVAAYPLAYWI